MSLFGAALLVCLLASATQVKAQKQGWSATGALGTAHSGDTATLLANGKVLVVGGNGDPFNADLTTMGDPSMGCDRRQWQVLYMNSTQTCREGRGRFQ